MKWIAKIVSPAVVWKLPLLLAVAIAMFAAEYVFLFSLNPVLSNKLVTSRMVPEESLAELTWMRGALSTNVVPLSGFLVIFATSLLFATDIFRLFRHLRSWIRSGIETGFS